jgi:hypothetical protein
VSPLETRVACYNRRKRYVVPYGCTASFSFFCPRLIRDYYSAAIVCATFYKLLDPNMLIRSVS